MLCNRNEAVQKTEIMTQTIANIQNHLDGVLYQMVGLSNQIAYHTSNIAPYYSEMEKWEVKEYSEVNDSNVAEYNRLSNHIMSNESIFNEKLCKYNMSAAVFIASL